MQMERKVKKVTVVKQEQQDVMVKRHKLRQLVEKMDVVLILHLQFLVKNL